MVTKNDQAEDRAMRSKMKSERGSAGGWIVTIIIILVVAAGGGAMAIKFGLIPVPESLASQPWMASILPDVEEMPEQVNNEISSEDTLRNSYLIERSKVNIAEARITELELEIASKDVLLQEKEDEIASLRDTINLSSSQNISSVALIYEAMDPKDASVFLTNLGPDRASLILGAMRENKAADVMSLMDESIATQITEIIAGFDGGSNPSETESSL